MFVDNGFYVKNDWQWDGSSEGIAIIRGTNKIDLIMIRHTETHDFYLARNVVAGALYHFMLLDIIGIRWISVVK